MTYPKLFILFSTFILFFLLLVFGTSITKLRIISVLHLFDVLLISVTIISLFFTKFRFRFHNVVYTLLISLIYFIFSFLDFYSVEVLIRQYAVFIYLACAYILFSTLLSNEIYYNKLISYLKKLIFIGLFAQIIYLVLILFLGKFDINNYNYMSPLAIMLVISCCAFAFIFTRGIVFIFLFTLCLILSYLFGHSSAILAIFIIAFLHFFLNQKSTFFKFFILITSLLAILLILLFIPSFTDANAVWRLAYWGFGLKSIFIENFGIFGNGFGVEYVNEDNIQALSLLFQSANDLNIYEERFLKAFHNSFITIFFHIGFLPSILIFLPFINFFNGKIYREKNKELNFLFLTLIGLSVWCSFNVVLELPHSSIFFWFIYFLYLYNLKFIKS